MKIKKFNESVTDNMDSDVDDLLFNFRDDGYECKVENKKIDISKEGKNDIGEYYNNYKELISRIESLGYTISSKRYNITTNFSGAEINYFNSNLEKDIKNNDDMIEAIKSNLFYDGHSMRKEKIDGFNIMHCFSIYFNYYFEPDEFRIKFNCDEYVGPLESDQMMTSNNESFKKICDLLVFIDNSETEAY